MKSRAVTLTSAALAIGISALAAGCGSTSVSKPTPSPTKTGGTLTVAESPQTNLDWYLPISNAAADSVANAQLQAQIFKPLIHLNDQYQIVWKSSIASKITYNTSGTVYTCFLAAIGSGPTANRLPLRTFYLPGMS